jgi:hypothetical protein
MNPATKCRWHVMQVTRTQNGGGAVTTITADLVFLNPISGRHGKDGHPVRIYLTDPAILDCDGRIGRQKYAQGFRLCLEQNNALTPHRMTALRRFHLGPTGNEQGQLISRLLTLSASTRTWPGWVTKSYAGAGTAASPDSWPAHPCDKRRYKEWASESSMLPAFLGATTACRSARRWLCSFWRCVRACPS